MIVNQALASIPQGDRVRSRARIRQRSQSHAAPSRSFVLRPYLEHFPLLCATDRLKLSVRMKQDAWLDRADCFPVIHRANHFPGLIGQTKTLEMNTPAARLGAAATKDVIVIQLHGLVFYWAEKSFRQTFWFGPRFSIIVGGHHHAPPTARAGADFVKEQQRAGLRLKQNRIPARIPFRW